MSSRLPSLTVALVSMLAATAEAQSGEGLLTVGQGGATYNVLPGPGVDAQPVFQQAVDRLATVGGGELLVLSGHYEFFSPVVVSTSGITIRGSRGAELAAEPPAPGAAVGILLGTGDRTVVAGLTFVDESPDPGEQSLVHLSGRDTTVRDCVFRAANVPAVAPGPYVLLDVGDRTPGAANVEGFHCEGNRFEFSSPPVGATVSTFMGVRMQRSTELRLVGNEFTGPVGPGYLQHAMLFDDSCYGTVTGNVLRALGDATSTQSLVRVTNTTVGPDAKEGHHLVFSGNVFKDCGAASVLRFDGGHGFHAIKGNTFHRCRTAMVLAGGSDYVISNNAFQEMIPDTSVNRAASVIEAFGGAFGFVIEGNQFRRCRTPQISCTATEHVKILGNQFVRDPLQPVPAYAVRLDGGSGHRVYGNSAIGFASTVWDVDEVLPNRQPSSTAEKNYADGS